MLGYCAVWVKVLYLCIVKPKSASMKIIKFIIPRLGNLFIFAAYKAANIAADMLKAEIVRRMETTPEGKKVWQHKGVVLAWITHVKGGLSFDRKTFSASYADIVKPLLKEGAEVPDLLTPFLKQEKDTERTYIKK